MVPEDTPLTVESPLPEVATLMQDTTSDSIATSEMSSQSQNSEVLTTRATTPMVRIADVQTTDPTESTPTPPAANTAPEMSADASVGG